MTDPTTHLDIETLSAFADGELNAVGAARTERHLGECASCRASLERVRRLVVAAQALTATELPPPEVWTGIRDRLQRPTATGAPRRWWHNGWLATAASWMRCLSPIPAVMHLVGHSDIGGQGLVTLGNPALRFAILATATSLFVPAATIARLNFSIFDRARSQGVITDERGLGERVARRVFFLVDPQRRSM